MTGRLEGRVAVVTGGTRGLGLAIARAYGRQGARALVVGSRSQSSVDEAVESLRAEGFRAAGMAMDVSDQGDVEALRDLAVERYGTVDVWVNNAGHSAAYGPVNLIEPADFLSSTRTVVMGTYFGSLAALDVFTAQGSGHLVNLLGRGDKGPVPYQAAYTAAKSWVRSFTLSLAGEQRGSGIRVHAFNPGLVRTDLLGRPSAVKGYEGRLARLPRIAAMWGRDPDEAALPAVDLVCGATVEYQALTPAKVLSRTLSYGVARLRRQTGDVAALEVRIVEARRPPPP